MDVGLGWLGVTVGIAGCAVTYRIAVGDTGGDRALRRRTGMVGLLTLVLTLLFWAIAMQKRLPFSPGQRLGLGFLVGGTTGVLAQILSSRFAVMTAGRPARLALHSMAFFALFGASLTYSFFHGDPQTALLGFSIGAVMAGILYYYSKDDASSAGYMQAWSVLAVTLAVGTWLSVAHFHRTDLRIWWPLPILLGSTVLVAGYIASELSSLERIQSSPRLGKVIPALALVAIVLGLSAIYSTRLVQDWRFFWVVAIGLAVAGIALWLASRLNTSEDIVAGLDVASAVVLLTVAFAVAAFREWAGLGIALGLLAAWPVALLASGSGDADAKSRALRGLLSLGLVILLFRLFIERYRPEIGSADLRIHYTFIGALLGAIIPFTFVSSLARLKASAVSDRGRIARIAYIGLIAALTPLLLFLVWEVKAVLGLIFGLGAAVAFLLMVDLTREDSLLNRSSIVLLAVGAQLSAVAFIGPLIELELTRQIRILVLAGIVLIGLASLAVTGMRSARGSE